MRKIYLLLITTVMAAIVNGQTTLISPTGNGGFENGITPAANGWTAVNSTTDNWIVGTAPVVSAGTNCGYISSTPLTTQTWTYSQLSVIQHLYTDVTIPAGETKVTLSFKWKVGGEGTTTSDWDNMKVFWGVASSMGVPVANTGVSAGFQVSGPGAVSGMYKLSSAAYNSETINLTGVSGTTYRLVFSWKSDGSTIANPPAAIDEVSLVSAAPASISSTVTGGLWSQTTTWVGGVVPNGGDNATIVDGATVTIDMSPSIGNLIVGEGASGILQYEQTTARVLAVSGNITVNAGAIFRSNAAGTITTHGLTAGGDLTNNGTIDFSTNTNTAGAQLTFTGASNNTFACGAASSTDLRISTGLTLNKGTSSAAILDFAPATGAVLTAQGVTTSGFLAITNGTFKISGTATISSPVFNAAGYSIPSTGGIWLNNANFTITGQAGSPTMSGLFRLTNGLYTIGTTNNSMGFASGSSVIIEGGIVNAVARFGVSTASNTITYNQSAGIVYVNSAGGNASATLASFDAGTSTSTSFTMSGGTIVVCRGSANTEYRGPSASATLNITGGTVQLGTAAVVAPAIAITPAATTFRITAVTPNAVVNASNNPGVTQAGTVTVFGDMTLNGTGTYTNNLTGLTIRGNSIANPGNIIINFGSVFTINSSNTQILTFSSSFGNQSITNSGTITASQLPSVTINNTFAGGTVTVPTGLSLMGGSTLVLTSGVLTVGGAGAITFIQTGATTQTFAMTRTNGSLSATSSSFGVAAPTTLNYNYNTSTAAQTTGLELPTTVGSSTPLTTLTINNASGTILDKPVRTGTLTLTAGQLTTSAVNLVTVTGTTVASVARTTGYVNGPIERTLPASLTGTLTYNFPVGKGTYNPIDMVNPTTTAGGTVVVKAEVFDANAGGTPGINMGSLNTDRYWASSISSGGANFTSSFVRLTDASSAATSAIASSATQSGTYDIVGGISPTIVAGTSVTSVAPAATSLPGFFVIGTKAVPMTYSSSTTTQTVTTPVLKPSNNQQIIGVQIVTTGNSSPLVLASIDFSTNGSTNPAGDISTARVWYTGTSSTFAQTTQFGSDAAAPSGAFTVNGTQVLAEGTNYFWLVYDIPSGAAVNNLLDAECTSINYGTAQTPTVTAPAGSRIIKAPLNGTYLVGASQVSPNYTKLTDAISDLNTFGVSGAVVFELRNDYSSASETFPLTINAYAGASISNTLLIRPASGVTPTITGSSSTAIIVLNGADFVTIDGSATGGTDRGLTIVNTNTSTSSAVVWMQTAAADGTANNTIKNLNITGNSNATTLIGIGAGSSTIGTSSLGTNNNSNTIQNNNITKTQYGIYSGGASVAVKNSGNTISKNLMNGAGANAQSVAGILLVNENNITVTENNIANISGSGTKFGISLGATSFNTYSPGTTDAVTNAIVHRNTISSVVCTGGSSAFGIVVCPSTTGTNEIINNAISAINGSATPSDFTAGIYTGGGAGSTTKVYYNSVSMSGSATRTTPSYALAIGGTNPVVDVRNNVLYNSSTTSGASSSYAFGTAYSSSFSNLTFNYNDLFTTGANAQFAGVGSIPSPTNQVDLATLNTTIGGGANSIAADPLFNSTTNLVPQVGSPAAGAGTPLAGITIDLPGVTRSVTTPSMGAYETAADAIAPVITYTTLTTSCATGDRALNSVAITDVSGVPTAGALQPRVYYRKNAGSWFSSQGALATGTGINGTWNFTIVAADMGGLTGGDIIQYYVIAQDVAAVPNISANPSVGLVATDVNTVTTPPTTPNSVAVGTTLNGTYTVGSGGNYTTLTAAITAYNNGCLSGPVIFELTDASYSAGEIFPIAINLNPDASAVNTLTIRPTVTSTVSGANTTSIITFNGAKFVTIDGRIGSAGTTHSLTITNTNNTAPSILLINDATSDVVKYADLKSDNTGTSSGVVVFSTTTGANGNDNNTIDNCNIGPNAANPVIGIFSSGSTTTAATNNSSNIISNNNIFDFFTSTGVATGVLVSGGNTDWTITGNSLYQTASRAFTAATSGFIGISISNTSGNNFTVNNNFVGGSAVSAGGAAWTQTGAFTHTFIGIRLSVGATTASNVQGNTIKNVSVTTSSTSTINAGISAVTGTINVGNTSPNIIGDQSITGSIAWNGAGTGAQLTGILAGTGTPGTINISNNTIGGIAVTGAGTTVVRGINIQGSATSYTVSGNTVGSAAVANSISNSTNSSLGGIISSSSSASVSITGNTVVNLAATGTSTGNQLLGISSSAGTNTITGNTIRNLGSASASTSTSSSASVIGLLFTSTTAPATVSQNTVFALSNSDAAAATAVTGIHYAGPTTGTNVVARNLVYGLTVSTNSATSEIRGISFTSGLANVQNNMIAIGTGVANGVTIYGLYELISTTGSGIYFNSVYVGGTGVGVQTGNSYAFRSDQTLNTRTFQNNVFMNARSNAAAGGKHYAVRVAGTAANPAGLTINNNDYFVSGTGGVFGFFNAADVASLAAWQTAVGQDGLSLNVDPLYIAPVAATPNLHITSGTTTLESAAATIPAITNDFDNDTRPGTPSGTNSGTGADIGADEFDGINPNLCTGTPAQGGTATASIAVTCSGNSVTFTLTAPFTSGPGISYQWQTSPAGAGTWSNVAGAITTVASFPITGNTDVRCLVKCIPSGLNTPSTTVTVNGGSCQFNVTRTTGITYNSIAGTGTSMSGWRNTSTNTDDNLSTSQPIGFAFPYKGATYSNFSVSTNGYLTFNVGTSSTGSGSSAYGWDNTQFTSTSGTLNALAPFYDDLVCQGNPGTAAGLANGIKYQLSGTPGSQVLTVEWIGMETFNNAGPNLNFQVKLYEATGQIDYIYGTFEGYNGTANYGYSYSLGLNAASLSGTPVLTELQTQQTENVQNFLNTAKNTLARMPECSSMYSFIPGTYSGAGTGPGIPANDEPAAATTLAVNGSPCTSYCGSIFTSFQATASAGITTCTAVTPGTADDDVWFKFTATTSQQTITVRGGGGYDAVVQLFSDQGTSSINCVNANGAGLSEVINATGLTPGNVYYVRVYHAGTGSSQAPTAGTTTAEAGMPDFSICVNEVVPPPSNDDPCGAVPLTVGTSCTPYSDNSLPSNTSFLTATTTTVSGVTTPSCTGAGASVNDVWFSFVAPGSGAVNVDITPVAGVNPAVQIYSATGSCPATLALTSIGCVNGAGTGSAELVVASSLTPGATYYIRVYQHPSGTGGAPVSNSQFSICVYAPLPSCPATFTPTNGANTCLSTTSTLLSWTAATNATGYDVYFDAGAGPATTLVSSNQAGLTYNAGILTAGQYSWRIEPKNGNGTTVCSNLTFTVLAPPSISVTPAGPVSLCAPATQTLTGTTSASSPAYQWVNGTVNIAGQTTNTYIAATTGAYRLVVTDGVTGCRDTSNTVLVTVNNAPVITISPATATISCDSVKLTAFAGGTAAIKMTEITMFRTGTGATATYPAFVAGSDLVEISNISNAAVNVGGYKFADYTDNSATAIHPYTIPVGTSIPANSVLILHLGTGTDDIANRYFNTGGTSDFWLSSDQAGFVLKDANDNVTDVVGLGGSTASYTFAAGTGVAGGDFTGFAPNASGFAGVSRTAATDNNAGSDWVQSNTPAPLQTIGTYNGGYIENVIPVAWSPATGLFTNAALTIPYVSGDLAVVFAKPTVTTTYTGQATFAGCTASNTAIVTALPAGTLEWTGNANTDWTNPGNWKCGIVPVITSDVIINSGRPNYPLITLDVEVKSLTAKPGASVTVATGFTLKLNGL